MLLYTDGLIEERRGDIEAGLERLRKRVHAGHPAPNEPAELVEHVLRIALHHDDVALLAAQAC